jgi:hypothetical protein
MAQHQGIESSLTADNISDTASRFNLALMLLNEKDFQPAFRSSLPVFRSLPLASNLHIPEIAVAFGRTVAVGRPVPATAQENCNLRAFEDKVRGR